MKVTRDLTEQHELEEALRSSEERLRLLVGQVVDYAIIALDPQGIIETWNLGAERVKGYTADEAIGRSFTMFYPDEDRRRGLPLRLLAEAADQGRVEHTGWRVRKDGTRFWGDVVITALHDEQGNLTGYAKVTRDLTEQHALEEALRSSEERMRLLVGQVVDYAIIALDPQGIIETWNLGAERVKGYTADEAIGRSFAMFYTEEDRKAGLPLRLLTDARRTGRVEHSGWRVRKDGSRFWGDVVITALHDAKGRITGYAKVTRDRTDLKALEDAQDAFYATFNHDFRTPVTAIKGFVDAIRDADDATRSMLIDKVESSADRLMGMVEGLVEFATQRAGHASLVLADIDLAQVARSAVADLSGHYDPARVHVADTFALATANGVAMHRVVTNLVVNALKYSPPDSPVDIEFSRARAGHVRMTVTDEGRGIDPGDIGSIFDEFFRGRLAEEDGGSGLGLASVRELVHQQNGTVSIESEVGVGTTVTVELPSHATLRPTAPAQRSASPDPSATSSTGGGREPVRVVVGRTDRPLPRIAVGRGLHLLAQLLAGAVVQPVTEHRAVGVVGLVLQAARQQAAALVGDVGPLQVGADHAGVVGPRALHEGARVGQAPFLRVVELPFLALRQLEDRVAHHAAVDGPGVVGAVEHEDRQVDPDLAGSQADAVGGVHRGDHVRDERAQLVVVRRDRARPAVHHLGAPARDGADRAAARKLGRVGGDGQRVACRWGSRVGARHAANPRCACVRRDTWTQCGAACNSQLHFMSCLRTQRSARPRSCRGACCGPAVGTGSPTARRATPSGSPCSPSTSSPPATSSTRSDSARPAREASTA